MDLLENCVAAYPYCLSELPSLLTVKAGFTPGTGYLLKVTDKFGNRFSAGPVEAAGDGSITINPIPNSFPAAWFNREAGKFLFEFSETAQPWQPVQLSFGGNIYTAIVVEFVNDNSGINIIE